LCKYRGKIEEEKWEGHVAHMLVIRNTEFQLKYIKERDHLAGLGASV
jgi:hypothetical protein